MRERTIVMQVLIDDEPKPHHRPIYTDSPSFPPGVIARVKTTVEPATRAPSTGVALAIFSSSAI
jgi:hypothetical protein